MMNSKLFGKKFTDNLSGFTGVLKGISVHATGCVHIGLVKPGLDAKGEPNSLVWFDSVGIKGLKNYAFKEFPILNKECVDTTTGFKGIVTKVTEFHGSDPRVTLQGSGLHQGIPVQPYTCDFMFVERCDKEPLQKPKRTGCSVWAER